MFVYVYVCAHICGATGLPWVSSSGMPSTSFKMGCLVGWSILLKSRAVIRDWSSACLFLNIKTSSMCHHAWLSVQLCKYIIYLIFLWEWGRTHILAYVRRSENSFYQVDCAFTHWAVSPTARLDFLLGCWGSYSDPCAYEVSTSLLEPSFPRNQVFGYC